MHNQSNFLITIENCEDSKFLRFILTEWENMTNNQSVNIQQIDEQDAYFQIMPDHVGRVETPNVVLSLLKSKDIDAYDYTAYGVIKMITGDYSECWYSKDNLAELCGFSKTRLDKSLENLSRVNDKLNKPLILITERFKSDGSRDTSLITVTDVWPENGKFMRSRRKKSNDKHTGGGSLEKRLPEKEVVRQKIDSGSPREYKQDPSEQDPIKEINQSCLVPVIPNPQGNDLMIFSFLKDLNLSEESKISLSKEFIKDEQSLKIAVEKTLSLKTPPVNLGGYIRSVARTKPKPDKTKESVEENIKISKKLELFKSPTYGVEILSKCIEFIPLGGMGKVFQVNFSENGFIHKVKEFLSKLGFKNKICAA